MTTFEAFFGFTGTPFSRDIAVNQLLETESAKELQGRLNYVARMRAFGVFTGTATPFHADASKPGSPASAIVGTSGRPG